MRRLWEMLELESAASFRFRFRFRFHYYLRSEIRYSFYKVFDLELV
jgi:hypothetical protein